MPGCSAQTSAQVVGPPVLTSLSPLIACANDGNSRVGLNGGGFLFPRILVDNLEATLAFTCPPQSSIPFSTCDLLAIYSGTALPVGPGTHSVVVENGTLPPVRSQAATLTVAPGPPFVLGPNPGVVYNGVDRKVFVSISGLAGSIVSAGIVPWGGVGPEVPAKSVTAVAGGASRSTSASVAQG